MDTVTEVKRAGGVATIRLQSGEEIKAPSALYLERKCGQGRRWMGMPIGRSSGTRAIPMR